MANGGLEVAVVRGLVAGVAAAWLLGACAPVPEDGVQVVPGRDASAPTDSARAGQAMVPPGYGTLHQDQITVGLRSGGVLVKTTPLDESIIRLLAPDTYDRLRALRENRETDAARNMSQPPELFLVSFFSYQPDMTFQPEDLQIMHRARLLRPLSIVPLTTRWGQQRLDQQETQTAIYVYEGPFDFSQTLTFRYGLQESNEWREVVSRLDEERSRIWGRIRR